MLVYKDMPCRIGITENPSKKRKYWQHQVVELSHWQLLASFDSSSEAQAYMTQFAKLHGCHVSEDYDSTSYKLCIYHFEYTRTR